MAQIPKNQRGGYRDIWDENPALVLFIVLMVAIVVCKVVSLFAGH